MWMCMNLNNKTVQYAEVTLDVALSFKLWQITALRDQERIL